MIYATDRDAPANACGKESVAEKRGATRLALLIRTAKLSCAIGEFLCIIRDVSESGIKLRLFHRLPKGVDLWLELSNGDRFAIHPVWQSEDEGGFRFNKPIDLQRFVAEPYRYQKRALRLQLTCPATLTTGGQTYDAMIRDISRQGAKIETQAPLAVEQKLILSAPGLSEFDASVRWRENPHFGLALQHIFSYRDLAVVVARMQLPDDRYVAADQTDARSRPA